MPRLKKTDTAIQSGLPFEVMPDDLSPSAKTVTRGRKKKTVSVETDVPQENIPETAPSPAEDVFTPVKDIPYSPRIPVAVQTRFEEIGEIIRTACKEGIDVEYYYLGLVLLEKLARKRQSPLLAGRAPVWAAGVLFALGRINLLFEKSSKPFISQDDLAALCGVKKTTAAEKGKQIRNLFQMGYWDNRFSTRRMQESNHVGGFVITKKGLIVNFRALHSRRNSP
ncbi:MAG: hypothetical protein STSR0009_21900 [Methanoregula sp.]